MQKPSPLQRRLLLTLGAAALALQAVPAAFAQVGGGRPVRIIVPFTPGSQTDVVARLISCPMADYLKQTVVVDSDLIGFGPDKLTLLGVSGKQRIRLAPEVPPIAESGLPGFEYFLWQGLLLEARTPQPAVERMASAVAYALADPAVVKGFQDLGIDAMKLDVDGSRQFIADEIARTAALVKSRGLKLSE
ncbi:MULTISPECIES: tripartite tricarboxylate transporter substrate-binding protein [unclassified Variovorax]|uniref:tripartite tricarboxylate transporter substrate-binding protein n=1 Tax=unclassified Variovorax TaxID=663243 RepID=UPI003F46F546